MSSLAAMLGETGCNVSLESRLEEIALEAGFVGNLIERIKGILPDLRSKLCEESNSISHLVASQEGVESTLNKKQQRALEIIRQVDFLIYGQYYAMVPENFSGSFLAYAEEMNTLSATLYQNVTKALDSYDLMLASFLTNKDDKRLITDQTRLYRELYLSTTATLTKRQVPFFKRRDGRTRLQIVDILSRFADIPELLKVTNKLTDTHRTTEIRGIATKVDHCVSLLDIIIEQISSGKLVTSNGAVARNLAEGAYEVARAVEAMTVFYNDTIIFLNCVDKLLEGLAGLKPEKK